MVSKVSEPDLLDTIWKADKEEAVTSLLWDVTSLHSMCFLLSYNAADTYSLI